MVSAVGICQTARPGRHARPLAPYAAATTVIALIVHIWLTATSTAIAGGGPENVLLLVNSNSDSSKTIANHYIELRKIPAQNVLYVNWKGGLAGCQGKAFKGRILLPALKAIDDRRIGAQIDYLVYSSDFPWRVDLKSLFPAEKFTRPFDGAASITGATYLTPMIVGLNPAVVMPNVNWYVPGPIEPNQFACVQLANVPSRGFRSRYLWDQEGKRTLNAAQGQRYLLSTMLGVTNGRGNTVEEVLSYLERAVAADGTRPRGTIYYMANRGVRSTTRDKCFASIAGEITRLGVRAVVVQGAIPRGAKDVVGLTTGVSDFNWAESGSTILRGAICDNLTSLGGVLSAGSGQAPLSEFLRYGAAGASGTVQEPRAIQAKFPLPSIHLHYARGCSLAEAFYQSVSGPYQLLIVGDPLCQPWAMFPTVTVKEIKPGQIVRETISITPSATSAAGQSVVVFDVFVDGRLTARIRPGKSLQLDTTKLADGHHELRLVGVLTGAIEMQGRLVLPINVKNHDASLEVKVFPLPRVGQSGKILVTVRQPGATAIAIRQNSREVARVQGAAGEVEIPAATLGRGPTTLQAFSQGERPIASTPVRIHVQ